MSNQHTPGPWSIHAMNKGDKPFVVEPDDGSAPWIAYDQTIGCGEKRIATVSMQTSIKGYPMVDNRAECDANVRLIIAAPDLLEALEAVVRVADRATAEFDLARAAIAKARGQA